MSPHCIRGIAALAFAAMLLVITSCYSGKENSISSANDTGTVVFPQEPSFELPEGWDSLVGDQRRAVERLQGTTQYAEEMLVHATADVEITVYNDDSDEITLAAWKNKWLGQVDSFLLTGGCGCCVDIYTVTGPRAAIEEFPVSEYRRQYYPRYKSHTGG